LALLGGLGLIGLVLLVRLARRRLRRRLLAGQMKDIEARYDQTLARFHVEVDRFKLASQGAVKVLLNHDHAIWTHVEELALSTGESRVKLRLRVHEYVEEIVPFFTPLSYYGVGYRLARWLLNALYRIDFRAEDVARIKGLSLARPRSVIYLMNHRSNVDYVLAAYVLAERIALSFAVGEWARVWPLEYLFKSFGSYFLRRGERDPLYHTVLRRYVQLVTKNAVTQALFPEGGLSRDGRLRAPKIGLLDNILTSKADRSFTRELLFVPVAVNYDRVLEDRALVAELGNERKRVSKLAMARSALELLFGNVRKLRRGEIVRHGYAAVRFGEPVSFDAWLTEQGVDVFAQDKATRRRIVADFCNHMMRKIAALIPATPLCVVAKVLVQQGAGTREQLVTRVAAECTKLTGLGVEVVGAARGAQWMVDGALERFLLRHLVTERDGRVELADGAATLLGYYAGSLAHYEDGRVPEVETPDYAKAITKDAAPGDRA
jgi:glycerol-3-phosphate O-acyltransferase